MYLPKVREPAQWAFAQKWILNFERSNLKCTALPIQGTPMAFLNCLWKLRISLDEARSFSRFFFQVDFLENGPSYDKLSYGWPALIIALIRVLSAARHFRKRANIIGKNSLNTVLRSKMTHKTASTNFWISRPKIVNEFNINCLTLGRHTCGLARFIDKLIPHSCNFSYAWTFIASLWNNNSTCFRMDKPWSPQGFSLTRVYPRGVKPPCLRCHIR